MPVELHTSDEHAQWPVTIIVNGTKIDYSTGYTFTCYVVSAAGSTLLTKTTGITGATNGQITVAFTGAELATATVTATFNNPVTYKLYLVPRKTSDSSDGPTVEETLTMRWRP